MKAHYNIYYLFLEDKANHLMSPDRAIAIQKNIEKIFKKIKPP